MSNDESDKMPHTASKNPSEFQILIIGAGIGGLALAVLLAQTGHHVRVVERKSTYDSLSTGGGINVTANALRVLDSLGIGRTLPRIGDRVPAVKVKRYDNGEVISTNYTTRPHMMLHRHDLLLTIYHQAIQLGVDFQFEKRLMKVDHVETNSTVHFDDGSSMSADILIGADGVGSTTRRHFLPRSKAGAVPTSDCVFFVDIPGSVMKSSRKTRYLLDESPYDIWIGPGRSIVSWYMTAHDTYHLQVCDHEYRQVGEYAGSGEEGGFVTRVDDMRGLRARWSDYHESIGAIFSAAQSCLKWRIATAAELPAWSTPQGRFILLGDAAHAVPPFAGQGAAMALEDAGCLATLIGYARDVGDMRAVAKVYENVRRPRVDRIRRIVAYNVNLFAMPDGEKQIERDRSLRQNGYKAKQTLDEMNQDAKPGRAMENGKAPQKHQVIEDYDVVEETRKAWHIYSPKL